MKKVCIFLCTVLILASLFCGSVMAFEKPAGSRTDTVPELESMITLPTMSSNLAQGLTTSPLMSSPMLNPGTKWSDAVNAIPELKLADIGNHLKYGFSMLGCSNLERGLIGGVDGVWTTGNYGKQNTMQFSTSTEKGALGWVNSNELLNVKGEPTPAGKGVEDGYIYQTLFTFNFGKVAHLDGFAYTYHFINKHGYPVAADVYISDDGVNWTCVGYYDRTARIMDGKEDYGRVAADQLGKDETGEVFATEKHVTGFMLPAGTKAQFLRIAATSGIGANPTDQGNYDTYSVVPGTIVSFREVFVFGTLTDEVKTPWLDPAEDPYLQATQTTEKPTEEATTPMTNAPENQTTVKPENTTKQPEAPSQTEGPAATPGGETQEQSGEAKKGCGSVIGSELGMIVLLGGLCGTIPMKRKKRK